MFSSAVGHDGEAAGAIAEGEELGEDEYGLLDTLVYLCP